jgi:hypothetical protein
VKDPNSDNSDILLRLKRTDELIFHFNGQILDGSTADGKAPLNGLTFIHTATQKDVKKLLTTDFNADPNVPTAIIILTRSYTNIRMSRM